MTRESDPENVCRLHTGSTGKLLPLFYCVGRPGHVLDPYGCLSPNLLTSKLVQKLEQNSAFCDRSGPYFTPPPLCLKQADTKDSYTVQIPVAAYTYFNYMTYRESPASVMERMLKLARDSFCEVLSELSLRREAFERLSGQSMAQKPRFAPKVLTWGQLYELCLSAHGPDFQKHMEDFIARSTQTDLRELTVSVLAEAHRMCPDRDPMIIVCFAPPYYPNSPALDESSDIAALCRHLADLGRAQGIEFIQDPTFDGLSDMSYMNIDPAACACDFGGIFPLWGSRYTVPVGLIRELSLPTVTIGARGKDLHRYTERVHLPYSLNVAAPILREAVFWLLSH